MNIPQAGLAVACPAAAVNKVVRRIVQAIVLATISFSIYVLWTWWTGAHTRTAHDPNHPWVSIGAAVGLILCACGLSLHASRRPRLANMFAVALLALAAGSLIGIGWTNTRPAVAFSFALLAIGLLSLRIPQLRATGLPAAFGVSSLLIAASVAGYFVFWHLRQKEDLYLLLASPLTAALQVVLSAAFLAQALRHSDLRALRRYPGLLGAASVVASTLICSWALVIGSNSAHARQQAEERVLNGVQVLTEHAHRTMDPANLLLQTVVDRARDIGVQTYAASHEEWKRARSATKSLKQVSALLVLDAGGNVAMYTEQYPAAIKGRFNQRDYFTAHERGVEFFLGSVIVSGSGKKIFSLSRRLTDEHGKFAGVVVVSMELDYFERFYRSIDHGGDTSIAMLRTDGKPLVRVPPVPNIEALDLANDVLFTKHLPERRFGTFLNASPFDGRQRVAAFRASTELPLVVVATMGSDPIAAGVEKEFVSSALLLVIAFVLLSAALSNQVRSRERERADKAAMAKSHAFTRSVLDSMSSSVAIIDKTGAIVDANAQWDEFAHQNGAARGSFIGMNYLAVCESARATSVTAAAALVGIKSVVSGEQSQFRMSYPCHSPDDQRWFRMLVTPLLCGGQGAVISHEDITELKLAEQQLERLASVDALTGLPNRRDFEGRIEEAMARTRRSKRPMALIFLDVDHFKAINDSRGHQIGDQVLKEVARRLSGSIRITDKAFRLAGDEFVVVLESLSDANDAGLVADKIVRAMHVPMALEGEVISVTTSLGLANYIGREGNGADLLERADRALYRAKAAGRNTFAETCL